jgi:hypothetical protein
LEEVLGGQQADAQFVQKLFLEWVTLLALTVFAAGMALFALGSQLGDLEETSECKDDIGVFESGGLGVVELAHFGVGLARLD